MKVFEEWFNDCFIGDSYDHKDVAAITWRAVLIWFYDKLGHSEGHKELKDLIEKELVEE